MAMAGPSSTPTENDGASSADIKSGLPPDELPLSTFGLHRHYRGVDITPDKCLLSPSRLSVTPSMQDGMDEAVERDLRFHGCQLIQSASILLKLPQIAAATGQTLYQRYFYCKSFIRMDFEHVAMACVLLASKIEEAIRRPRDVVNVFHHLKELSKRASRPDRQIRPLLIDAKYSEQKDLVLKAERRVLNTLGFCVHVKHPHKLITAYLKALDCDDNVDLVQKAWNCMNDGLRTDIFVRYSPETVACACIYLAARWCNVPLPQQPFSWWELFDVTEPDIVDIGNTLLRLYTRTKAPSWSRLTRIVENAKENYKKDLALKRAAAMAPARPPADVKKETETEEKSKTSKDQRSSAAPTATAKSTTNGVAAAEKRGDSSEDDRRQRNRNRPRDRKDERIKKPGGGRSYERSRYLDGSGSPGRRGGSKSRLPDDRRPASKERSRLPPTRRESPPPTGGDRKRRHSPVIAPGRGGDKRRAAPLNSRRDSPPSRARSPPPSRPSSHQQQRRWAQPPAQLPMRPSQTHLAPGQGRPKQQQQQAHHRKHSDRSDTRSSSSAPSQDDPESDSKRRSSSSDAERRRIRARKEREVRQALNTRRRERASAPKSRARSRSSSGTSSGRSSASPLPVQKKTQHHR